MMNGLTGTGALVRLILRRDRVLLPIWMLFMSLLPLSLASGTNALYHTDAERQGYINSLGTSPLLIMFYGEQPSQPSLGALIFWRAATGMLIMALIGLLFVIRHTRVEEEAGRRELIGSTVVGRHANLAAALTAITGASLVVGVLVALGMMSQQTPADGAFAMGLAWAAAAIVFGAIGAVTAQVTEGAGAARGIGIGIVGLAFGLRATADINSDKGNLDWLSWISPLGWSYEVKAYTGNRWWVFGLAAVFTLAMAYLAAALSARRDVGAGLLPPRLGPAEAGPGLRSPLALAWRLHRGALIAWTVGMAVFGVLLGASAKVAVDLLKDNPQLKEIFSRIGGGAGLADIMISSGLGLCAIAVAAYAIGAALKLRTEEASLRGEPLLATAVSRSGWAASHLTFAVLGPAVVMAATGLGVGLMHGADTGDIGREVPRALAGAMVQLPAIWVLVALTVAVFGVMPRLSPAIGWGALSLCLLLGQVGALLRLSQTALDVSPFTHTPKVPGGDFTATPLVILTGLAVVLAAAGFAAFRRRGIPVT
jgi:polyether ionophore transport system permease protein